MIKITTCISLAALSTCWTHCHFSEVGLVYLLSGLSCMHHSDLLQGFLPSERLGFFGSRLSLSSHSHLFCSTRFAEGKAPWDCQILIVRLLKLMFICPFFNHSHFQSSWITSWDERYYILSLLPWRGWVVSLELLFFFPFITNIEKWEIGGKQTIQVKLILSFIRNKLYCFHLDAQIYLNAVSNILKCYVFYLNCHFRGKKKSRVDVPHFLSFTLLF